MPEVVLHTMTGSAAATIGPVVEVDDAADDAKDDVVVDGWPEVDDVVDRGGRVVPDDELGPDEPHAPTTSTVASPAKANPSLRSPFRTTGNLRRLLGINRQVLEQVGETL